MNPYLSRESYSFWKKSIGPNFNIESVDPVLGPVKFKINRSDRIVTAGSCFAQHIANRLSAWDFNYKIFESTPSSEGASDENYGIFSCRFGNIYTTKQLLQLFKRAYGLFNPNVANWLTANNEWRDPFRPRIQKDGFSSEEFLVNDRRIHLNCVQKMFEQCDIFIFTLGLTESWECTHTGAVFPIVPQAINPNFKDSDSIFKNFSLSEMKKDLLEFIDLLRSVNSNVKIVLTVSPVALMATNLDRHVLVSNSYSKAALRVLAEEVSQDDELIYYFPSYEIILGQHTKSTYLCEDLREVREDGVLHVMSLFKKHLLTNELTPRNEFTFDINADLSRKREILNSSQSVICDEEIIDHDPSK